MNAASRRPFPTQRLLWLVLAALTLLATVLRTLSLLLCLDEIGYFQKGAVPVVLFYVVIALIALACLALFFLLNKESIPHEPATLSTARFVGAALAAVALAAAALFLIFRSNALPIPTPLVILTAPILLCGTVYFAMRLTRSKATTTVLFGYGAILATALSLILTYFDPYTQMNAPHKLSQHVCLLAVMVALLLEQRDLLDRPLPRACVSFTAFATAFCTATALPNILAFIGGVFDDPLYLFLDVMILGLAAYFGTKCAQYALVPAPAQEVEL